MTRYCIDTAEFLQTLRQKRLDEKFHRQSDYVYYEAIGFAVAKASELDAADNKAAVLAAIGEETGRTCRDCLVAVIPEVIDYTAPGHAQYKSRDLACARFVNANCDDTTLVPAFIEGQGGIAACAANYRRAKRGDAENSIPKTRASISKQFAESIGAADNHGCVVAVVEVKSGKLTLLAKAPVTLVSHEGLAEKLAALAIALNKPSSSVASAASRQHPTPERSKPALPQALLKKHSAIALLPAP